MLPGIMAGMDRVVIERLALDAFIGVHAWERRLRQPLWLDIELASDVERAARHDALVDAIDYVAVSRLAETVCAATRFALVETLAEHLASVLLDSTGVDWLRLRVRKSEAVGGATAVGVAIERHRQGPRRRLWLSLGSNIDRETSLRAALDALRERFGELVVSPIYESEAVGFDGEPFHNLVVGIDSEEPLGVLNEWMHALEAANGRVRGENRFAARTLDVDILTWGHAVGEFDGVRVPRDEILEYAFVLGPLSDVAPDERHPLNGRRYAELWGEFDQEGQPMRRLGDQYLA